MRVKDFFLTHLLTEIFLKQNCWKKKQVLGQILHSKNSEILHFYVFEFSFGFFFVLKDLFLFFFCSYSAVMFNNLLSESTNTIIIIWKEFSFIFKQFVLDFIFSFVEFDPELVFFFSNFVLKIFPWLNELNKIPLNTKYFNYDTLMWCVGKKIFSLGGQKFEKKKVLFIFRFQKFWFCFFFVVFFFNKCCWKKIFPKTLVKYTFIVPKKI